MKIPLPFSPAPHPPQRSLLGRVALGLAVLAAPALSLAAAGPAAASPGSSSSGSAVFVQLDNTAGNAVAAYRRAPDGTLIAAGHYGTGGKGGTAVGAPVDALASQGSLTLSRNRQVLLAVNAGSDSLTSFAVHGARLDRSSVVPSKGQFPVSVGVHAGLVYVLNGGGSGSVSGFRLAGSRLLPLAGSTRTLGLDNTVPPAFLASPGQVGFTPDGRHLLVTTKAGNTILSFAIGRDGRPSATPTVTSSIGQVPFSFVFDARGRLEVTQAGDGALASYRVRADGSLQPLGASAPDGQAALCWSARIGRTVFGANAGSGDLSSWTLGRDGTATLTHQVVTTTGAGPIDLAASPDGHFLYVQQSGAGTLGVYAVDRAGHPTAVQTVTGLPAFDAGGMEGIAVS